MSEIPLETPSHPHSRPINREDTISPLDHTPPTVQSTNSFPDNHHDQYHNG